MTRFRIILSLILALSIILGAGFLYLLSYEAEQFALIAAQVTDQGKKLVDLEQGLILTARHLSDVEKGVGKEKSQDELITQAVAKVAPSVVSIVISKDVPKLEVSYENPFGNNPLFKDFDIRVPVYRQRGTERQKIGAGTGFLVSRDGYILTNRHVVADEAADYMVLLSDGTQRPGKVAYRDATQDVALLKIDGEGYAPVTVGDSSTLKLGQSVIAIGNALGEYSNSVSVGIISGLDRTVEASSRTRVVKLTGIIQTDAAINPGNSGGPLLDLSGRVVGVNVATIIGSNSISFAIPANTTRSILSGVLKI